MMDRNDAETAAAAHASLDPPVAQIDVQDPLPETNWFWRRVYTFVFTLISVAFIWYGLEALWSLREAALIYSVTRYMIFVHVMLIMFYMVAPSAEQIIKMIQTARLLREGVPITRTAKVQAATGETAQVQTTAGVPATPDEEDFAPTSKPERPSR